MKLRCLNDDSFSKIKGRPVYLVMYSELCLDELCDAYDILGFIRGAVSSSRRMQGRHSFRGHAIEIMGHDAIPSIPEDAVFLIVSRWHKELFAQLQPLLAARECTEEVYFFPDREMQYDLSYRERYKDTPLRDMILFRSGPGMSRYVRGMDFADNARELFEHMLREGFNEKYELVWIVHDPEEFSGRYEDCRNVRFLPYDGASRGDPCLRDAYYEALCLAKYIFFTDTHVFARNARQDQVRVQLWHGCGMKTRSSFVHSEMRYEYMTVTGGLYARLYAKVFGLRPDQMLVTGYPKNDLLFRPLAHWQARLQLPAAKKYIFWLPTFRTVSVEGLRFLNEHAIEGETGLPVVDTLGKLRQLDRALGERDVVLIVKLHPLQRREAVMDFHFPHVVLLENDRLVQEDVQINAILGHADALVSDYSSAAVDYTLLDRPIAFTLDDCQQYQESRGFLWPDIRQWLPGEEIFAMEDFLRFVHEVADGKDPSREKRRKLAGQFHDFSDGHSSARVLAALGIRRN